MSSKLSTRYRPRVELNRHTNLVTQQRRLRHLTCIVGRNFDTNLIPITRQTSKCTLLSLYYTIHAADNDDIVLYKSEIIDNTLNPNWKEFDSNIFANHPSYTRESSVKVCIWGSRKQRNTFQMILCYQISFSGLVYKKEQLRSSDGSYASNCLLFRLFDGYYTMPSTSSNAPSHFLYNHMKALNEQVCPSYRKTSILRVNDTVKAINQTRTQVNHVRLQMERFLANCESKRKKQSKLEALSFHNNLLKQEINLLKDRYKADSEINNTQRNALKSRESDLEQYHDDLDQYVSDMKVCHSAHIGRRETLLKVTAHLNFRRRQLAAELSYIYPIIELSPAQGNHSKREYSICGVKLPNSEEFVGEDESMLAVAVGSVSHLVYMMAKFLELPLRYPINPMGSRSSVVDYVTDKLTDKEREFPLYSKGKEKFQFNYGVFLLNKNIAQLRYHNGLGTADLRNTLPNLKQLLEAKYGVRIVMKSDSQRTISNNMMANRAISLPTTSTPLQSSPEKLFEINQRRPTSPTGERPNNDIFSPTKERPKSEVLPSGLPSVHVKQQQQQHRFISRQSTNKKIQKSHSLPESENVSPDLIGVPFEDVIQRTIDGELHNRGSSSLSNAHNRGSSNLSNAQSTMNDSLIDLGEDCMSNGNFQQKDSTQSFTNITRTDTRALFNRQLSDALIIPDPYDKEQDEPRILSEDIIV